MIIQELFYHLFEQINVETWVQFKLQSRKCENAPPVNMTVTAAQCPTPDTANPPSGSPSTVLAAQVQLNAPANISQSCHCQSHLNQCDAIGFSSQVHSGLVQLNAAPEYMTLTAATLAPRPLVQQHWG